MTFYSAARMAAKDARDYDRMAADCRTARRAHLLAQAELRRLDAIFYLSRHKLWQWFDSEDAA